MQGPGILITIELDPFYQNFLKEHFGQAGDPNPFFWPKNHILSRKFTSLLSVNPSEFTPTDYKENSFIVDVPYMSHINKDPFIHNYLSKKRNFLLTKAIKDFFDMIFHEFLMQKHKDGFNYVEGIEIFMDEYNIDSNETDRLLKNYQRWRAVIRQKKFQQKSKKSTSFHR